MEKGSKMVNQRLTKLLHYLTLTKGEVGYV